MVWWCNYYTPLNSHKKKEKEVQYFAVFYKLHLKLLWRMKYKTEHVTQNRWKNASWQLVLRITKEWKSKSKVIKDHIFKIGYQKKNSWWEGDTREGCSRWQKLQRRRLLYHWWEYGKGETGTRWAEEARRGAVWDKINYKNYNSSAFLVLWVWEVKLKNKQTKCYKKQLGVQMSSIETKEKVILIQGGKG